MRLPLLVVLALIAGACSAPSQTTSFQGVVLNAGPGEAAVHISNPGAHVRLGPSNFLYDNSGALAVTTDLQVDGGVILTPYVVNPADGGFPMGANAVYLCDATTTATTLFLPAASARAGRQYEVLKTDVTTHACSLSRAGADTINVPGALAATSYTVPDAGSAVTLVSDGTSKWWVLSTK